MDEGFIRKNNFPEDGQIIPCSALKCPKDNRIDDCCGIIIVPYEIYQINKRTIFDSLNTTFIDEVWTQNGQKYCSAHGNLEDIKKFAYIYGIFFFILENNKTQFFLYRKSKNKKSKHRINSD
jgi:hypothetical protein